MYDFIKSGIADKKYATAMGFTGGLPKDMPFADFESNADLVKSLNSYNDVAIMTLSRCGAEGSDVTLNATTDGLKINCCRSFYISRFRKTKERRKS